MHTNLSLPKKSKIKLLHISFQGMYVSLCLVLLPLLISYWDSLRPPEENTSDKRGVRGAEHARREGRRGVDVPCVFDGREEGESGCDRVSVDDSEEEGRTGEESQDEKRRT